MSETVFISYAHKDAWQFANKITDSLTRNNCKVFFDDRSIAPGTHFTKQLEQNILDSAYFIAILTPGHRDSEWCNDEWEVAKRNGKHVIPILFEECDLRGFIGNIQAIDFRNTLRDEAKFTSRFEQLMSVIVRPQNWRDVPVTQLGVHSSTHDVRCITKNTPIKEALNRMNDADFKFRHFLVTENGKVGSPLQGIIGYRHILKKQMESSATFNKLTVNDVMRAFDPSQFGVPTFVYVLEEDTLSTTLQKFTKRLTKGAGILFNFFYMSAIPIVDAAYNATGIISFKDVMGAMVRSEIPIPDATLGAILRKGEEVCISGPTETPVEAKHKLLRLGQRDVVVVDNEHERTFQGLVSDGDLIVNMNSNNLVEKIMVRYRDFEDYGFSMTSETSVVEMLTKYILTDYSKSFYDFPVISYRHNGSPHFEGLIGYRDVFRALSTATSVVYYQDVAS
jgi:CBS domain-containing protein